MKKKGLSPIVASVLLIVLVMVLASIVFLWARGFVSEQIEKFGQPVENICEDVAFEAELIDTGVAYELEISNRGNVPIYNFDIKGIKGGDSKIEKFDFGVGVGEAENQGITITSKTEKIVVYPAILGSVRGRTTNKVFTCVDKGKTLIVE